MASKAFLTFSMSLMLTCTASLKYFIPASATFPSLFVGSKDYFLLLNEYKKAETYQSEFTFTLRSLDLNLHL